MFNSRKINNDPEPYVVDFGLVLGEVRSAEDCGSHWDSHDTRYEPRPEFDNNPNPILTEFRLSVWCSSSNVIELAAHWTQSEEMWEEMCLRDDTWNGERLGTPEQEDHARKVLERLVKVYG